MAVQQAHPASRVNRRVDPTGAQMRAVRIHRIGPPGELVVETVARPAAGPGDLLVQVTAAGVNPADWKIRSGDGARVALPFVLGGDVAGRVVGVGEVVSGWSAGEPVYASTQLHGGGYAEYVALPAQWVARAPSTVDLVVAGSLPLAALTAWQAFERGGLAVGDARGRTVLVHAAAGGVGSLAVQIGAARGVRVVATASGDNAAFVRGLGAELVIDYTRERFEDVLATRGIGVDMVFDTVGGDVQQRSWGVLRPGGVLVSIVGIRHHARSDVIARSFLLEPDGSQLGKIAALVDAGALVPQVSAVLPLAEAARANELSAAGHTRGKIVLAVTS